MREDFIQETIEFWRGYAGVELTREEARQAIENAVGFITTLARWQSEEAQLNEFAPGLPEEGERENESEQ